MDDDNCAAPIRVDTSIDGFHTINFVHLVHLCNLESLFLLSELSPRLKSENCCLHDG